VGDALAAVVGKAFHPSGQKPQAWIVAFVALFKQQLQAKANAKQGAVLLPPAQQMGHEPCGPEVGHGGVKSSDPRKDQSVNAIQLISAFDQPAAFPQTLKASLH
jgi:hypothetical protein